MSSSNKKKFRIAKEQSQRFARENPDAFIAAENSFNAGDTEEEFEFEDPAYCVECESRAQWVKRASIISSNLPDFPYCKVCAKFQPDFRKSDEKYFWEKVK